MPLFFVMTVPRGAAARGGKEEAQLYGAMAKSVKARTRRQACHLNSWEERARGRKNKEVPEEQGAAFMIWLVFNPLQFLLIRSLSPLPRLTVAVFAFTRQTSLPTPLPRNFLCPSQADTCEKKQASSWPTGPAHHNDRRWRGEQEVPWFGWA